MCDYGLHCGSREDPDKTGLGCFPGTTVPFCLVSRLLVPHLLCHRAWVTPPAILLPGPLSPPEPQLQLAR